MRLITLYDITGAGEDMFDGYLESQTETATEIEKKFSVAGRNAVAILNNYGISATLSFHNAHDTRITESGDRRVTEAGDIRVTEIITSGSTRITESGDTRVTEAGDTRVTEEPASIGEVQSVSLIRDSIKDWWDYFFAPSRIGRDTVFYFPTQPAGAEATLKITYTGGTAKCGLCLTGVARDIMTTRQDLEIGIDDYSIYTEDEFGQLYLNPGNWAKRVDAKLFTEKTNFDIAFREIVKNRATTCIYDYNEYDSTLSEYHTSEEKFTSLIVYGFTEDFNPEINEALAEARHEVKGFT